MNKKVNIKAIITVVFSTMLFLMGTISLAGENYSAVMTLTGNSEVKTGEVITINVNLNNIIAGNGIDSLTATLDYDTDVFEQVKTSDFISDSNWSISYAPTTNKMTALKYEKITNNEAIFKIKLRVKSNINTKSTKITIKDITVSGGIEATGGTGDITVNDVSKTINIVKENYSAKVQLTSNSKIKAGEIVTVSANVTDIVAGAGIDALAAELDYDSDIFEIVTQNDFTSNNNWNISYSKITNKMTALKYAKITNNETIFTLNLRAKSEVNVNATTITLKNITVSGGMESTGGTGDIEVRDTNITINKAEDNIVNISTPIVNNTKTVEQSVQITQNNENTKRIIKAEKIEEDSNEVKIDEINEEEVTEIKDEEKVENAINEVINELQGMNKNKTYINNTIVDNNQEQNNSESTKTIATVSTVTSVSSLGYCVYALIRKLVLGV